MLQSRAWHTPPQAANREQTGLQKRLASEGPLIVSVNALWERADRAVKKNAAAPSPAVGSAVAGALGERRPAGTPRPEAGR